jgi:hypothetical protein
MQYLLVCCLKFSFLTVLKKAHLLFCTGFDSGGRTNGRSSLFSPNGDVDFFTRSSGGWMVKNHVI